MINTKTAVAGTTATAITGGIGYAIYQGTAGTKSENVELKTKLQNVSSIFDLNFENEECKEALREENNNETNYKKAIVACLKDKSFDAIATTRGLFTFKESNKEDAGGNNLGNAKKADIKKIVTTIGENETGDEKVKDPLKTYCESKKITENTKNKEGYDYLNACTKDVATTNSTTEKDKLLENNFGTNNQTIASKLKAGNGEMKADDATCTEKINKDFSEVDYKNSILLCANSGDLEKRAEELELTVLKEDNKTNGGGSNWWTSEKSKIKEIIKTLEDTGENNTQTALVTYCNSNKTFNSSTTDAQGHNYLKVCTKDNATDRAISEREKAIKKDFGHNQANK